jgi:hypothetical protein
VPGAAAAVVAAPVLADPELAALVAEETPAGDEATIPAVDQDGAADDATSVHPVPPAEPEPLDRPPADGPPPPA